MPGWNDLSITKKTTLPKGWGAVNHLNPVPTPQPAKATATATPPAATASKTPTPSAGAVPPMPQNTSYYGANTNPGVTPTYGFGGQHFTHSHFLPII